MRVNNNAEKATYANVWVVAEVLFNEVQPVTYELLGAARALADARDAQVWAVVTGRGNIVGIDSLFAFGADKVIVVSDERLTGFIDELEADILTGLIENYKPEILLGAATARGRALIPRVAVKTNSGLTADCTELGIDPENGGLLQTRPAFGGNILAVIRCPDHRPQMATVRPRVMKALTPDFSKSGEIIYEKSRDGGALKLKRIIESVQSNESAVNLGDARLIIAGGRGLKGPDGFTLLRQLAEKTGGALGASRAAVDAGWIPYAHQVGQTGQTVQTKAYIAFGISGQIQHLVGMQSCDLIVAVDKDPETPMMKIADIAVVGDLFEIVPAFIEELNTLK